MTQRDIDIRVDARYVPDQSDTAQQRHTFAYTITIANHGLETVQLLRRHWIITNGQNQSQEVRGDGVVGQQPVLAPGQKYQYTSGAVIDTRVGTMQGEYTFVDEEGSEFDVSIPTFSLVDPSALN